MSKTYQPILKAQRLLCEAGATHAAATECCLDLLTLRVALRRGIVAATSELFSSPLNEAALRQALAIIPEAKTSTYKNISLQPVVEAVATIPEAMLTARLPGECYERILDLPTLADTAGDASGRKIRREGGSFYTPQWVIQKIIDQAYALVADVETDALTLCDPALGSGHFLLTAAQQPTKTVLYGVDRDPTATRLARRALWLELSRPEKPYLPPPENFRSGDSLLGETWVPLASSVKPTASPVADEFNWGAAFPTIAAQGGFDLIVGNPPYEALTNFRARPDRATYAKRLRTSGIYTLALKRQINLYRCFIERSLSLLKPGGVLAMIVPGGLLTDDAAAPLRCSLLCEHGLDFVARYNEGEKVFAGVNQEVAIFRARKNAGAAARVRLVVGKNPERTKKSPQKNAPEKSLSITHAQAAMLSPTLPLPAASPLDWQLIEWLGENISGTFADLAEGFVGEVDQTVYRPFMKDEPTGTLLLRGNHLQAFDVDLEPLPSRERFLDRDGFLQAKGRAAEKCLAKVNRERIVQLGIRNRQCVPRLVAARIAPGIFLGNSLNFWLPRNNIAPELICGLLNSRLYDWRFRLTSGNNNINLQEITPLPCPTSFPTETVAAIRSAVIACEKSAGTEKLLTTRAQLDSAIFDLFDLPKRFREYLHNE